MDGEWGQEQWVLSGDEDAACKYDVGMGPTL